MRKVYIVHSLYSLFLILCSENIDVKNDIIIISKDDFSLEILNRLKKHFKVFVLFEPKNKVVKFINYYIYLRYKLKRFLGKEYKIIMSCDHRLIGQFFIKNKKEYELYEEGTATIANSGISNIKIRNILGFNKYNFGRSIYCKKVYLTLTTDVIDIKDKVVKLDMLNIWKNMLEDKKNKIIDIFMGDFNDKILEKGKYLLLTQPLSEDKIISEKEKIELYGKIIEKYDKNLLILKTHPREKTKYNLYFKDIIIMDNNFPIEILFLLSSSNLQKVITIFSSSVINLNRYNKDLIVDYYGTEIHPKILEKFGTMDEIMKRTAFL
ncbi:polysialyltransferase family glycosyltransferase [Fusobacterium sp.]|uniref:polysialyltransferase family glycosyltransferase n=1 Tax=Fusobacterium sp. TaxID=68766 RepID=UPI002638D1F0|nr:polysialyltransferase family glycosyltransferase [Fusobacterium sp.]